MAAPEVVLGVTGGIAAYKAADLCSRMVQAGTAVSVVLTGSAHQFIGPATFAALTNRPVHSQVFDTVEFPQGPHIGLARRADVLVIAPATAATLARCAHGLADDLLTTLYLAFSGPVLMAPAMNCEMWASQAVQRNVNQLRSDGVEIVDPAEGWLSCGTIGAGRMADPGLIWDRVQDALRTQRRNKPRPPSPA
ncbi:MAG: flavoprotein [Planctomycetaceae bacterium]